MNALRPLDKDILSSREVLCEPVRSQALGEQNGDSNRTARPAWRKNAALFYASGLIRGLRLFRKYRTSTMYPSGRMAGAAIIYAENLALLRMVLRNPDLEGGCIIECGTWRGGMAAGMIEVAGTARKYHFFDSFEGLPPAGERDGFAAREFQSHTLSPTYFNNCTASLEEFEETISKAGCPKQNIGIHKGFFETTLPAFSCPPIAVLRLDADWYDSTMICLEKFWDHVMPGGLILIDDYYTWEGCSRAVHAFLAKREARERLHQGPLGRVVFVVKEALAPTA